jgi:hypothetical protein
MSATARTSVFALVCVAGLAGFCLPAAADSLDTSRLPRVAGAKQTFASPATTIYTAPGTVAHTAEAARKALSAGGWQAYVAPFTAQAKNPATAIMSFKKGPQALNVFITRAPAQGNATSVSYTAVALPTDLPFPKDASDIEFDPHRPLLICITATTVEHTLASYREQLGALGWSLWSAKLGGKQPAGGSAGETTKNGAFAYYIRENQKPLVLSLRRGTDGRTKVELKGVPAQVLIDARQAEVNGHKPAGVAAPAVAKKTAAPAKPEKSAADDMANAIMKQALQMTHDATAGAMEGAKPGVAANAPKGAAKTLRAGTGHAAPIPLPETADAIDFDGTKGKLEFNSASSVSALAAFYRAAMKPLGWQEHRSVINRPNMVVLDFTKSGKKVSLTIMQMGNKANVSGDGSGLRAAKAKTPSAAATAPAPVADKDLEADESGGLPVPKRHTMTTGDQTPFRRELNASVPVDLTAVLAFYRRELGKRGWKEQTKGAVATANRAVIAFSSADGPAVLKLGRKNGETTVNLAVRNQAAAAKAGVLPKTGQAKLLFGNALGSEVVITINRKTIKIAAGAGKNGPDGPTLNLPPGKYTYSLKMAGNPAKNDAVEVSADETWGLLVGPGGVLPLHMY